MNNLLNKDDDDRGVVTLTLNRPQVHNAFNAELIAELSSRFDQMAGDPPRVLVLTGAGPSFSAGADLNWMRAMAESGEAENRADAARLAAMLRRLDELPCPTIARINGPAFGGGVGLIACCDIAIAADDAVMGLSEVRLGLIPATIAPFVLRRIGPGQARRWMLTAERMDATEARRVGLVDEIADAGSLDVALDRILEALLAAGPGAQAECKKLIREISGFTGTIQDLDRLTAERIATIRVSGEGREGLNAFLEKRKPSWNAD